MGKGELMSYSRKIIISIILIFIKASLEPHNHAKLEPYGFQVTIGYKLCAKTQLWHVGTVIHRITMNLIQMTLFLGSIIGLVSR